MFLFGSERKLYAPETELGAGDGDQGQEMPVPMNERPADGPGSGRGALRKQLEGSVAAERKEREVPEKGAKGPKKSVQRAAPNHQAAEPEVEEAVEPVEGAEEVVEPVEGAEGEQAEAAPERFSKEAKEAWAETPAAVKAAVLKGEKDVIQGVTALKQRYKSIDDVLTPRMEMIRRHGHTPAAAVNQLFAWFEALAANPAQAFPALAQSFKFDLAKLVPQPGQQGQEQPGQQGQEAPKVDPGIEQMLKAMREEFGGQINQLTSTFQQQSMAKTQEVLDNWSNGKPYFEDVRQHMAHLIGTGAVPPLPNGSSDLDKAYDMAVWAIPEIRAKVLADQEAARTKAAADKAAKERKLQQEQANKARRGSVSLTGSAPGNPVQPGGKKPKGKSVRESIMEAREEVTGT